MSGSTLAVTTERRGAVSPRMLGALAVLGVVIAFSQSSTLVKRAGDLITPLPDALATTLDWYVRAATGP
jgi:hypothetical protein